MTIIHRLLKWVKFILLLLAIIIFGFVSIVTLLSIIARGAAPGTVPTTFIFVGITIICTRKFIKIVEENKAFSQYDKQIKIHDMIRIMGKVLNVSKACPDCEARLAVCEKTNSSDLIRLGTLFHSGKCEYYCPACEKRFDLSLKAKEFVPVERELPEKNGKRFYITSASRNVQLFAFLLFTFLGLWLTAALIQTTVLFIQAAVKHSFVSLFYLGLPVLFLFLAYRFCINWLEYRILSFELVDDGLVLTERKGVHFYAWEDFRIVTMIPKHNGQHEVYIFDMKQRVLTITKDIEQHEELAYKIIEHIEETAKVDPNCFIQRYL